MGFRALQNTGDHRYWSPKLLYNSHVAVVMQNAWSVGVQGCESQIKSLQVSKKFHSACTAHLGLHLEAPVFETIAFFGLIIEITKGS